MPRRVVLPASFVRGPFSVEAALASGIGRGRLRGPDLVIPFRGSRDHAAESPADALAFIRRRCAALLPLLGPAQFFSHTTAAVLWGCPFPRSVATESLHVTARAPARALRRHGVVGHQVDDLRVSTVQRFRLPVTDAASVFFQLAPLLSLDDLVVAGDHLVQDPPVLDPRDLRPYALLDDLRARSRSFRGRGAVRATNALSLVRVGAESRFETLLRLILLRAGFPEPEVNPWITGVRRRWRYRADLVFRERRVVVEYDGDHHRVDARQYEYDMRRFDDFVHDGWGLVRVRKYGVLTNQADTVQRVRSALAVGGRMPA